MLWEHEPQASVSTFFVSTAFSTGNAIKQLVRAFSCALSGSGALEKFVRS